MVILIASNQIFFPIPPFFQNQKALHLRSRSTNKDLPGKRLALLSRNVLTASPSLSWTRAVDSDKGIPKLKGRIRPERRGECTRQQQGPRWHSSQESDQWTNGRADTSWPTREEDLRFSRPAPLSVIQHWPV